MKSSKLFASALAIIACFAIGSTALAAKPDGVGKPDKAVSGKEKGQQAKADHAKGGKIDVQALKTCLESVRSEMKSVSHGKCDSADQAACEQARAERQASRKAMVDKIKACKQQPADPSQPVDQTQPVDSSEPVAVNEPAPF